mmetsp:Transcript_129501/g.360760  ORF Transcript_129501/g.360760 Transcript_129501/m.360760 type:complete len:1008 (-) Transcript_129501:116-3139(-)
MQRNAVALACVATLTACVAGVSGARVRPPHELALLNVAKDGEFKPKGPKAKIWNPFTKEANSRPRDGLPKGTVGEHLECKVTERVDSKSNKAHRCPADCPFYAQDRTDNKFCTFHCVSNVEQCVAMNPKTPIVDWDRLICRKPMVQFCAEYEMDGTDTCKVCDFMFRLGTDGQCYSVFMPAVYTLGVVLLIVVVFLLVWILDLFIRPLTNYKALDLALKFRSWQKLRMDKGNRRRVWPLSTNLLREAVAGAGMMIHFNFQVAIIIWAALVGCAWIALASLVDPALFILGTRRFGTPRENCILVAWGYEKQQELMWTKVGFLVVVYVLSFVGALLHSVRQLRLMQAWDYQHNTMKDYAAILEGLPEVDGSEHLEEELKQRIMDATNEKVVGVSIAWNFHEHREFIFKMLEKDSIKREKHFEEERQHQKEKDEEPEPQKPSTTFLGRNMSAAYDHLVGDQRLQEGNMPDDPTLEEEENEMLFLRRKLFVLESAIFGPGPPEEEDPGEEKRLQEVLRGLRTSSFAFVVFNTQAARDAACSALKEEGFKFKDATLQLHIDMCEPDTVEWENFGFSNSERFWQLIKGLGFIGLALLFWTVVFYAPYAASIFSFSYDNGQEPGIMYGIAFSMVVVVGNQIMYEVCARVSENIGFRFNHNKAGCYMLLFTVACVYNVLVDVVTTYFMAETIMKELGFRTYNGVRLSKITDFTEMFETYAIQRSLAENVFLYAFPSTYLLPFLLEPIFTIGVPLMLGILVVRSHRDITGRDAEALIAGIPMDMGRYADIILNVVLGIMIFYFPGGYTHWLFLAMAASHAYIYWLDHYRLLRSVPALRLATLDVDWWAQAMLAPCIGLMLSCLVFKANCQHYGFCMRSFKIVGSCFAAFVCHCVLHLLLLIYCVPYFGLKQSEENSCEEIDYEAMAMKEPYGWFSMNPVHCLRSQHIYQHQPPCRFCHKGKEHLLQYNADIGCYFTDAAAETEDYVALTRSGRSARKLSNFFRMKSRTSSSSTPNP